MTTVHATTGEYFLSHKFNSGTNIKLMNYVPQQHKKLLMVLRQRIGEAGVELDKTLSQAQRVQRRYIKHYRVTIYFKERTEVNYLYP